MRRPVYPPPTPPTVARQGAATLAGRELSEDGLRFCRVQVQWLISLDTRAPWPPVG